ncbi:omptin family outer membrane protease [Salmonella enterica]|nr:omptin family outer membrane protease [Salmonella enterica]
MSDAWRMPEKFMPRTGNLKKVKTVVNGNKQGMVVFLRKMIMRIIIPAVILISSGVLMDGTVQAGTWTDNNDDGFLDASEKAALSEWFTPEKVSVGLSVGTLSGSAKERVYDNGRRLSQLDWKFKNAPILKGTIDWDITPWVRVGDSGQSRGQ